MKVSSVALTIFFAALASGTPDQPRDKIIEKSPAPKTDNAIKKPIPVKLPIYRPPLRGAPKGRVGGGTRGAPSNFASVSVLAPDHSGLTAQEQPSLYWYLSRITTTPIELTIIEEWGIRPILETRISAPIKAGVQRVRLSEYGVRLQPGIRYRWFVALVPDPENRSKDMLAGGMIERTDLAESLRARLAQPNSDRATYIYAEAGIWYDAVSTISELIDVAPDDVALRQQRAALLEQVGLQEIAHYDRHGMR